MKAVEKEEVVELIEEVVVEDEVIEDNEVEQVTNNLNDMRIQLGVCWHVLVFMQLY